MPGNTSKFKSCTACIILISTFLAVSCSLFEDDEEEVVAAATSTLSLEILPVNIFHFTWTDLDYETGYRLLENPDGISGYTLLASLPANTTSWDHTVSLPDRVHASYLLQACAGSTCTDQDEVFVTDVLTAAIGYFKASNTDPDDHFGSAVSLSGDGNTLAVGATSEDSAATGPLHPGDPDYDSSQLDNSAFGSGAVYIFTRTPSGWTQQALLKAWNADRSDEFGSSLALSDDGNTLAVGAPREDSNGLLGQVDNSTGDSGAVYVFTRSNDTWYPEYYVKASQPGSGDNFGESLALSGDGLTLAVGAEMEDSGVINDPADDSVRNSGAVYVFVNDASTWYQQAYLKPPVIDEEDRFGNALSLSHDGNVLAVGCQKEDSNGLNPMDNTATDSGAVYVFTRSGFDWNQQVYIKASSPDAEDDFGFSVSLSSDGNTLAVGAPFEDGDGSHPDDDSIRASGAVYVFSGSGIIWSQTAYLKASTPDTADWFGFSVTISADGLTLAAGTPGESSSAVGIGGNQYDNSASYSGAVYRFSTVSGIFTAADAFIKAPNTGVEDQFGNHIALSGNGETMAVGAVFEDSSATGIGGDMSDNSATDSGAVYLY